MYILSFAVDFVVYILLCLQVYNFRVVKELSVPLTDFLKTESLINYIKVCIVQFLRAVPNILGELKYFTPC